MTQATFSRSEHGAGRPTERPVTDISPTRLVVRCLLQHKGDQWQAFTLEFGLAAQADSDREAREKLERMLVSYLRDALTGEDREHAYELLSRKATWQVFLKYHLVWILSHIAGFGGRPHDGGGTIYREPLPMQPCAA